MGTKTASVTDAGTRKVEYGKMVVDPIGTAYHTHDDRFGFKAFVPEGHTDEPIVGYAEDAVRISQPYESAVDFMNAMRVNDRESFVPEIWYFGFTDHRKLGNHPWNRRMHIIEVRKGPLSSGLYLRFLGFSAYNYLFERLYFLSIKSKEHDVKLSYDKNEAKIFDLPSIGDCNIVFFPSELALNMSAPRFAEKEDFARALKIYHGILYGIDIPFSPSSDDKVKNWNLDTDLFAGIGSDREKWAVERLLDRLQDEQ